MIIEIFKEHNNEMLALVGKDSARGAYNRYEAAMHNVQEFLQYKYKVMDVSLDKLFLTALIFGLVCSPN